MKLNPFDLPPEIQAKYRGTPIYKAEKLGSTTIRIYPNDSKRTGKYDVWEKFGSEWHRKNTETTAIEDMPRVDGIANTGLSNTHKTPGKVLKGGYDDRRRK